MALTDEFVDEFRRLSSMLDAGLDVLRANATMYAEAEHAYRLGKAKVTLQAPAGTVLEKEAWINGETAALRRTRDQADGMRTAALESVRSRRAQISALQSLLAANRAEIEMAATGPRLEP